MRAKTTAATKRVRAERAATVAVACVAVALALALVLGVAVGGASAASAGEWPMRKPIILRNSDVQPDVAIIFEQDPLPSLQEEFPDGFSGLPRASAVLEKTLEDGSLRVNQKVPSAFEVELTAIAKPPEIKLAPPPAFEPVPVPSPLPDDFLGGQPSLPNFFDHSTPLGLPDNAIAQTVIPDPQAWRTLMKVKTQAEAQKKILADRMQERQKQIELVQRYIHEGEEWIGEKQKQWDEWLKEQRVIAMKPVEIEKSKVVKYQKVLDSLKKDNTDAATTVNMMNSEIRKALVNLKLSQHKKKLQAVIDRQNAIKAELERSSRTKEEVEQAVNQLAASIARPIPPSEMATGPLNDALGTPMPEIPTPSQVSAITDTEAVSGKVTVPPTDALGETPSPVSAAPPPTPGVAV